MEVHQLENFTKGWFIGDFNPTLFLTNEVEVAVKEYKAGDEEAAHYHAIATEFTLVLNGSVIMNNEEYHHGSIIKIQPGEVTNFKAITNVQTVVVKLPCVKNDKFLAND
ncbi:MAG: hypothetical protein ACOVNY_01605 [Chitinophagaceae bacterium]